MNVPKCFLELDEYFDTFFKTSDGDGHQSVILAENLCRRMADVELYAQYIFHAQSGQRSSEEAEDAAVLVGTFLVAYFSACKSVFDAASIALSKIYDLRLTNKGMNFSKDRFREELEGKAGTITTSRYTPFRSLSEEIVAWRDSAVHRITPFVVTYSHERPWKAQKIDIIMASNPDTNISAVIKKLDSIEWVEPLYYHTKWREQLIRFCAEICQDIRTHTL
jgi:hypothetical protein